MSETMPPKLCWSGHLLDDVVLFGEADECACMVEGCGCKEHDTPIASPFDIEVTDWDAAMELIRPGDQGFVTADTRTLRGKWANKVALGIQHATRKLPDGSPHPGTAHHVFTMVPGQEERIWCPKCREWRTETDDTTTYYDGLWCLPCGGTELIPSQFDVVEALAFGPQKGMVRRPLEVYRPTGKAFESAVFVTRPRWPERSRDGERMRPMCVRCRLPHLHEDVTHGRVCARCCAGEVIPLSAFRAVEEAIRLAELRVPYDRWDIARCQAFALTGWTWILERRTPSALTCGEGGCQELTLAGVPPVHRWNEHYAVPPDWAAMCWLGEWEFVVRLR